jgi:thiamine biosynthesis lipoprotein
MQTHSFRAMNTQVTLAAEGNPSDIIKGFEKAQRYIEVSEKKFTRFSETSELSKLNHSAGSWFKVSKEMLFFGMLINQYVEQTRGLFDPSILPNLERIGYDCSMDRIREKDSHLPYPNEDLPTIKPFKGLKIHPSEDRIFLPTDTQIDLGGIAKGWIAEQAATILSGFSSACLVDAGGDMFMIGIPDGKNSWSIDIEDPQNPGDVITTVNIPPGAIATSSIAKRRWTQGDQLRHHIIDPRTGEPANTDWLSVTVMAPHGDMAEVFAKAFLIAGSIEAEIIAHNLPDVSYLAIAQDGSIWGTPKSLEYIYDYKSYETTKK